MTTVPNSPAAHWTFAARWTYYAAWSLCLARGPADVEQWRQDNARYLERIRDRYPDLNDELETAIARAVVHPLQSDQVAR